MIFEEPVFRPLGDCYVSIEFGDEADILLSFRVLTLAEMFKRAEVPGIVEIHPTPRQLAIIIDRSKTNFSTIRLLAGEFFSSTPILDELPSRLVTLPTWYDDPWSDSTASRFGVENNLGFVADQNGLTREQVVEKHVSALHWNCTVGFTPGGNWYYPMDRGDSVSAPTYNSPRSFTPARAVGLLGRGTTTYPIESPGGIQLIGRIAVDLFDPRSKSPAFSEEGVLLRAGDRIKHRIVDPLEYDEIRTAIFHGNYEYEVVDEEFNVRAFLDTADSR